jgi:hypothetical protein
VRTFSAIAITSLVLFVAGTTASGQDKVDYMPLKVGNTWTHKVEVAGMQLSITQKVTRIEKKGDKDVGSLEMEVNGMTITEQMSSTAKGIFRHSFNGTPVDPPVEALRLPIKKGDTWEGDLEIMGQKVKAKFKTEGEEEVTVPAGKYKAVIVAMDIEAGGQSFKAKNWFAPNVGIVKQTFDFGAISGSSELEKMELKK